MNVEPPGLAFDRVLYQLPALGVKDGVETRHAVLDGCFCPCEAFILMRCQLCWHEEVEGDNVPARARTHDDFVVLGQALDGVSSPKLNAWIVGPLEA